MSNFKEAKVVMLPTNKPSKLGDLATYQGKSLAKVIKEGVNLKNTTVQFWNLYIISDDEIKEGDWFYNIHSKIVGRAEFNFGKDELAKKIIATTNSSLWRPSHKYASDVILLPQPSQQFINKYIEEYNKGNIITDVLVEYELISNEEYFGNTVNPDNDVPYFDEKLKINPKDNTITIKKVKDSYTREEILDDIEQSIIQGLNIGQYRDKWIEENL